MEFNSVIRRNKKQKMRTLAGKFAINIAKSTSDPTYHQYKMAKDRYMKLKEQIMTKYRVRGRKEAAISSKATAIKKLGKGTVTGGKDNINKLVSGGKSSTDISSNRGTK